MNEPALAPLGVRPMAVIYLRVSTKDQAGRGGEAEGFSIPAQREACIRKADAVGAVVVAEFVDAGESARSANRPELQNMLSFIKEHKVQHVIVHKIDRLARNRVDDVEINIQISAVGAQLVSCSENIDETPSGMLMHGIMSSIAEFYSRNLATESRKGMKQKAKNGGTPGMACFGYLNSRTRTDDGREVRTVILDEDRAHWVPWIFERYATGDWTAAMIRDELVKQGVMTLARPNRPSRPIAVSHVNTILKNRYYLGVVTYEGVEYPGNHPALVTEAMFDTVKRVRTARHQSREKPRVHTHYLKGTVHCGNCGEPLAFERTRNHAGVLYDYFFCLGRQRLKNGCTFRAIQAHQLEDHVTNHWTTVTLRQEHIAEIRQLVIEHIKVVLPDSNAAHIVAADRLRQLERDSTKVLEAFYADAIGTPELRAEQGRIATERAALEQDMSKLSLDEQLVTSHLDNCLEVLSRAKTLYESADATGRRELNQSVFAYIYVDDDEVVASDLQPAFRRLMSGSLEGDLATERKPEQMTLVRTRGLSVGPGVDRRSQRGDLSVVKDLPTHSHRTDPEARLGGFLDGERPRGALPWEKKNHGPRKDRGSNQSILVAGTGFEPATSGL